VVARIHDPVSEAEGAAERAFLAGLGGGCLVPVGARGQVSGDRLRLSGYVGAPSGTPWIRKSLEGDVRDASSLGERLADEMLAEGADAILTSVRRNGERSVDEVLP